MKFTKMLFLTASTMLLASCSDDDNKVMNVANVPAGAYDNGILVLNQGGFQHGDASMTYISSDLSNIQNDIFSLANDADLGDTGQDVGFYNDLAYIVLNGSDKIEIANRYTMKKVGEISNLDNPRYIAFADGRAYVTNWGDGDDASDDYVAVVDLSSNAISGAIPVVEGPEKILAENGKLYVAHAGGFGYGSSITVINPQTNAVSSTIAVGDVPNAMQVEGDNLWVSCGGKPSFAPSETTGSLVKISLASGLVTQTLTFSGIQHPANLVIDGANAFYTIDSGIYKFALSASTLPTSPEFSTTEQGVYGVYSFAVKGAHIYVGDAGDYTSNGKVYIYSSGDGVGAPALGTLEKEYTVGVIPAGFYFNF